MTEGVMGQTCVIREDLVMFYSLLFALISLTFMTVINETAFPLYSHCYH